MWLQKLIIQIMTQNRNYLDANIAYADAWHQKLRQLMEFHSLADSTGKNGNARHAKLRLKQSQLLLSSFGIRGLSDWIRKKVQNDGGRVEIYVRFASRMLNFNKRERCWLLLLFSCQSGGRLFSPFHLSAQLTFAFHLKSLFSTWIMDICSNPSTRTGCGRKCKCKVRFLLFGRSPEICISVSLFARRGVCLFHVHSDTPHNIAFCQQ